MIFDTHCHIQFKAFEKDLDEVILRCKEKKIIMNVVATQKNTSKKAVELAERHDNMYATIGLHPIQEYKTTVKEEGSEFISRGEVFEEEFYSNLVKSKKVIAIGETGLDKFHVPKDELLKDVMKKQKEIFLQHHDFAIKHDLPLVIHVREAHEEMLELLDSSIRGNDRKMSGVMHCFGGDWEQAEKYLDFGLYLGFTGVVTFPTKKTDPKSFISYVRV